MLGFLNFFCNLCLNYIFSCLNLKILLSFWNKLKQLHGNHFRSYLHRQQLRLQNEAGKGQGIISVKSFLLHLHTSPSFSDQICSSKGPGCTFPLRILVEIRRIYYFFLLLNQNWQWKLSEPLAAVEMEGNMYIQCISPFVFYSCGDATLNKGYWSQDKMFNYPTKTARHFFSFLMQKVQPKCF